MEKTMLYSYKGKAKDILPDLFATMRRAYAQPLPEGMDCLDFIDAQIRRDSDRQAAVVAEARAATHEE